MNSNTSEASPTILMEMSSASSNLMQENQPPIAWPLEPTTPPRIPSPSLSTGSSPSNPILMPSDPLSMHRSETNSVKPLPNLKSNAKPHEIQEKQVAEPRVLKVRKEDIQALCQVIQEFQEQFIQY
jgi:hypothetical protein